MYRDFTVNLQQHRAVVHAVLFRRQLRNFINVRGRKSHPCANMRTSDGAGSSFRLTAANFSILITKQVRFAQLRARARDTVGDNSTFGNNGRGP